MAKHKTVHRKVMEPRTTKEATNMIARGWIWLTKKYPVFLLPLTMWMLFGGAVYLYNYMTANTVSVKEAKPISQNERQFDGFSLMPTAVASPLQDGIPIVFDGQMYGYEDTTLTVKAVKGKGILLVYDKRMHKVYQVQFDVDYRMKFSK